MSDVFTPEKRSEVMRAIKDKDTKPELKIRCALHSLGYRYKLHDKNLPGKPDIVFPKYKSAIQVRGCFWHMHTCSDGHIPKSRQNYWLPKLLRNVERDKENDARIQKLGWKLLVVWACSCRNSDLLKREINKIISFLHC